MSFPQQIFIRFTMRYFLTFILQFDCKKVPNFSLLAALDTTHKNQIGRSSKIPQSNTNVVLKLTILLNPNFLVQTSSFQFFSPLPYLQQSAF